MNHTVKLEALGNRVPTSMLKNEYNVYDLLAIINRLIITYHLDEAKDLLAIAKTLTNSIQDVFLTELFLATVRAYWEGCRNYQQEDLYEPIEHYLGQLIPGAHPCVGDYPCIEKLRPDMLLRVNDELCVGKVRRGAFTKAHIEQLRRYIDAYECTTGYAFADTLKAELDENMVFVCISGLKDRFYKKPLHNL
jgi:hypothetical protein